MTNNTIHTILKHAHYHPSWENTLVSALTAMQAKDLTLLLQSTDWLPGAPQIFNAFSIPLPKVTHILLGESPYPRQTSANGYAFWDAAVTNIWSPTGLSKSINRATSLRNFIKMLLVTHGELAPTATQQANIAKLDTTNWIQTLPELFHKLLANGFLLLNASLTLGIGSVKQQVAMWRPFIQTILNVLRFERPKATLLLMGNFAQTYAATETNAHMVKIKTEHPYNLSFMTNPAIQAFFKPFNLLIRD